jgi:beta-N-acetylhexosaminidase
MQNLLREKIGQLFLVGVEAEELTANERLHFEEYGFGGYVLFKRNCHDAGAIAALCRALWDVADELPPFIAIDQEGGRVHRLPPPFTHFPCAARIGHKNDPDLTYRIGNATATELALAGINLDFAPVLDVNSNPDSPVIGDRAFSADARTVSRLGGFWTQGLRDGGIVPCGKHFPGHGGADKDSHLDLPVVNTTLHELRATELAPFVHACGHGIEALMTAHVLFPTLDPQWPATLSRKIITGLLRHQLGYSGVVFSDDMEMRAISARYEVEEAALYGILAGVDVLLFCHELPMAIRACEFLCAQAGKDAALRARVDESYARIASLKRHFLKSFSGVPRNELPERLGNLDHARILAEIYGSL